MKKKDLYIIQKALNKFYPFIVGVEYDETGNDVIWVNIIVSVSKFKEEYPDLRYSSEFEAGKFIGEFSAATAFATGEEMGLMDNIDNEIEHILQRVYDMLDGSEIYNKTYLYHNVIILVS